VLGDRIHLRHETDIDNTFTSAGSSDEPWMLLSAENYLKLDDSTVGISDNS
jgi:hypothetical protein